MNVYAEQHCFFCHNIKNEYTFFVSTETLFSVSKNKIHENNNIYSFRKKKYFKLFPIEQSSLINPHMLCITDA